jgi:hypothetical protein
VAQWLANNVDIGPAQLRMTLMEAYAEFDRIHPGKNLTMRLWQTIMYDHPGLQ